MSLVRLLTAGRSLVGLKESVSRYRVTTQRLLPKFEAGKSPFRTSFYLKPEPSHEPLATAVSAAADEARKPCCPSENIAKVDKPCAPEAKPFWKTWMLGLKSMSFKRERPSPRPGPTRSARPMFQTELSLDSVKVMRNDLSETDLEVVVAATSVKGGGSAPRQEVAATGAEGPWSRVTGRLFAVVKR